MSYENELRQAVSAIKSGDKKTGKKILSDILKADRDNARAWLWLSTCVDSTEEKKRCLHETLRLDPNNESAKKALSKLEDIPLPTVDDITPTQQVSPTPINKTEQKKTPSTLAYILVTVVICIVLAFIFLQNGTSTLGTHTVEYLIDGTAKSAMITYSDGTQNISQTTSNLPWKTTYKMKNGALPSLVAQNQGTGVLNCKIYVDGNLWKQASANNQFGVVTCSGMVGN